MAGRSLVSLATEELVRDELPDDSSSSISASIAPRPRAPRADVPAARARISSATSPRCVRSTRSRATCHSQLTSFVGRERRARRRHRRRCDEIASRHAHRCRRRRQDASRGPGRRRRRCRASATAPGSASSRPRATTPPREQVVAASLGVTPCPGTSLAGQHRRVPAPRSGCSSCSTTASTCSTPAARLAEASCATAPSVRVLATSREALGVEGEQIVAVAFAPGARRRRSRRRRRDERRGAALRRPRAVQRGRLRDRRAEREQRSRRSVAASTASRSRSSSPPPGSSAMSPAEIAARLDERFRLLTGGRRTAVERHQTLRGDGRLVVFAARRREQTVFDRLGVFAGSFDAAAAELSSLVTASSGWDVVDALGEPRRQVDADSPSAPPTSTRYQLLETLRARSPRAARRRRDRRPVACAAMPSTTRPSPKLRDPAWWAPTNPPGAGVIVYAPSSTTSEPRWHGPSTNPPTPVPSARLRIVAALSILTMQHRSSGVGAWAERAAERAARCPARVPRGGPRRRSRKRSRSR